MALVAYEYSDESDNNAEEESTLETVSSNKKNVHSANTRLSVGNLTDEELDVITRVGIPATVEDSDSEDDDDDPVPVSFSNLPKPNYHAFNVEDNKSKHFKLSYLNKLLRPQSSNKTVAGVNKKKLNFAKKDTGLLAVLPTPKQVTTFTPFKAAETSKPINPPKSLIPQSVKNAKTASKVGKVAKLSNVATDGDDEIGVDFFSLSKVEENVDPVDIVLPELEIDQFGLDKKNNTSKIDVKESYSLVQNNGNIDKYEDKGSPDSDVARSHLNLDDDAMHILCGRKRKGQLHDDIEVIDIHEDKILAKNKELLSKHLTDETVQSSHKRSGGFSSLSKRKHQITYLAFQAKEREIELKNQWANNRFTKKQTQQKYGF